MSAADVIEIPSTFTKTYPSISGETLRELSRRGLFQCRRDYWRFGDESNGTTRRLDGQKFTRADNSGADWHKLVGLADVVRHNRKNVLFVIEGSKDALAGAELAFRSGILQDMGIVCGLGSGYRPITSEIEQLRGRHVGLVGDRDAVGVETTSIVSRALHEAVVGHHVWDWSDWQHEHDKDLFDVLTTIGLPPSTTSTTFFFSFFSSFPRFNGSTVQPFNCSTQDGEPEGTIAITIEQFVAPHVVTKAGTGNRKSFDLARAVKTANANMVMSDITAIFDEWFARSQSFLPKGSDRDKAFQIFLKQLTRVRFMLGPLKAACERARTALPPFIPALDGNTEAIAVAALCKELQRDAGERGFICPVNVVQQFLGLRWPAQAHWLLHQLELNGVIECADRGAPNTPGKKGKPTLWRYRLPPTPAERSEAA
jgi:hypothetical protein